MNKIIKLQFSSSVDLDLIKSIILLNWLFLKIFSAISATGLNISTAVTWSAPQLAATKDSKPEPVPKFKTVF